MGNPKTKKPAKPNDGASKAPSTNTTPAKAAPATRHRAVVERLAAKQPSLTAVQRKVFAQRYTEKKCDDMGVKTRSEGVLNEAVAWAPEIARALAKHPEALRRYQPTRFAWFLACILDLIHAREEQAIAEGNTGLAKARAERAYAAAKAARGELLETLEEIVEGDDQEAEALAAAIGSADTPDRAAKSCRDLAKYARGWLARKDDESKELVSSAGLTLAEVEAAENAAQALDGAGGERSLEGKVIVRDTPAVNRVEGRLLLEMRAAMRVFGNANAKNKDVPKLVPGPATRAALSPRDVSKAKSDTSKKNAKAKSDAPKPGEAPKKTEAPALTPASP